MVWNDPNLIKTLKTGGVAVMPTDTLYGIVGRADNEATVRRIYEIRKRNPNKLCINLIGSLDELPKFNLSPTEAQENIIRGFNDATTFIIDSISFRLPQNEELQKLLMQTGPLIAPSANPEGLPPAENIEEAKNYFGALVDLYIDGGPISGKASKIIKLDKDGSTTVLRE